MKRFINFGSISQFRQVIKDVKHSTQYHGWDEENNKPIYKEVKLPKIDVRMSEKIHGTNAAVCYSNPDGFWVQSRKNIITPDSDNAGCAFAAYKNEESWMKIIHKLAEEYDIDLDNYIISVYYEWCGGNIQKNSAVSNLDKMAIIFQHFKVSPLQAQVTNGGDPEPNKWYETSILLRGSDNGDVYWASDDDQKIFNIMNFPTYNIEIDFNEPLMSQNQMIKLVEETIEPNSPVGKQLGQEENIGEGVVCTFIYKDNLYKFKIKGEKHANSKVKTLKKVDESELQKIQEIAQKVTPAWRLEQMFDLANDIINGGEPDVKNMGLFLKSLNQDIIKEESDVIAEASLEPKQIFGKTSQIARQWYFEQLNKDVAL